MLQIPQLDSLSRKELVILLVEWLANGAPPSGDFDELIRFYHACLPRAMFLKTLPFGSTVLDLGAGDGSLALYKHWPIIARPDLKLYAISLDKGAHFDLYEAYELKNFEKTADFFDGMKFDAVVCCHFIEHMHTIDRTIEFISTVAKPQSRIYFEWPHDIALSMPSMLDLNATGWNVSTTNFHDDETHLNLWKMDDLQAAIERSGFTIETTGRIHLPWVADEMKKFGVKNSDRTTLTLAIWAYFGWSQYTVVGR